MSIKSLLYSLLLLGFFSCSENKEEKMPEMSTPILVDTDTAQQNVIDDDPTNESKVLEVMEENKKPIANEVEIKSNGWGKKDAFTFLSQCEKNAKKKMDDQKAVIYCECVLANMKLNYPNTVEAEKIEVSDMLKMAKDCMESN